MKTNMSKVYGNKFQLLKPLQRVECWNAVDGSWADLPEGEVILVCHANDATRTTIQCERDEGLQLTHQNNSPSTQMGYRFIVPNDLLGEAIGVKMPKKTQDLIGDLIAYESGNADEQTTKRLFKTLKKTGIGKKLQGHYSRRM